tara:strand:+ start:176634 stop:178679 length:2046 start_codon:yes stop_codon:yes gene_type:complete
MSISAFEMNRPPRRSELRRDLHSTAVVGKRRVDRIVIDEISGRFAKVSDHVWRQLCDGAGDAELWQDAKSAGWTRHRNPPSGGQIHPLALKIPLGSIDSIARRMTRVSGLLFAWPAVACWAAIMLVSAILIAGRIEELFAALGSLPQFLQQCNPVFTLIVFVATKLVHELAHAVMCRRAGSRCGGFGVLLLCGFPCPYCDVTDIWRQPSVPKRIAVMMAGIYVELIVASLASLLWMFSHDPTIRFASLNVMIVCGVSTVVFNANPLMRYDGYYALSDLIGSTNLRRESRAAFASVVTSRLAGRHYRPARRSDGRAWLLSLYYLAAVAYRALVWLGIATLLVTAAEIIGIRTFAVLIVAAIALSKIRKLVAVVRGVLAGNDDWQDVSLPRRGFVVSMVLAAILAALFTPLPRYRRASGIVDAAFAPSVYLSSDGIVQDVFADFGDAVQPGQTLASINNHSRLIDEAEASGQWNIARLRGKLSRHVSLASARRNQSTSDWPALQAAEEAARVRLDSSRDRVAEMEIVARRGGILIPPVHAENPESASPSQSAVVASLHQYQGRLVDVHTPWCRISSDGQLHAVLTIDSRDREQISVGSPVKIALSREPGNVFASKVVAMSESHDRVAQSLSHEATFEVLCSLPPAAGNEILARLGSHCYGIFPLPKKTLADHLTQWIGDWASE